jgi:hypothetical protein
MATKQLKLIGIHEIASRISVTKQRAFTYTKMADFPLPVAHLGQGRVWNEPDVATFFKNRGRDW